ncbi:membrane protein [Ruminococcus albus]|uniref:membrane protein n=1 Tax=Ruminococcus albus TaxID=1264 RepID=UPI00046491EE|nr:membrane protein [Ruminococcus albus]
MADKYSIDDILSEYSNKHKTNNRPKADDPDNFDISFSKPENKNPAAVIPDIRSDRTAGKDHDVPDNTSSEKSADDAVIKKAVASSQRSDDLLMSDDLLDNASPIDEDLAMRNARKISKLSEKNVNIDKNGELSAEPVRRTSVKDIKFGLEGKIIPQSKYLDDISDEENTMDNATVDDYDSRSAELERHRKSKVESFVLDSMDDDEAAEIGKHKKISYGQKEFENYDEAPKVLNDILQIKSNLFLRLCVLLFTGLSSLLITVANDLEFPVIRIFDRSVSPSAFLFSNTIMGLLALGVSYSVMTAGLKNMFLRKPDNDSIAAVGIFVSVIAGIATLFEPDSVRDGYYHVYVSAAIMGLIFNTLGKMMTVQRTEKNFRYIAGDFERYAVKSVDGSTAVNLGRGAVPVNANMAAMRKTSFIEDFIKNSYAPDVSDRFAKYSAPIILIAGLLTGLLSFICDKHAGSSVDKIYVALAAFSGTVTMCSSLSLILAVNLPISKATNKYLQYSSVILGYSAVEEFSDTNSVMVDAVHLFPKESVDLINLKLLSTEPLDECILLASSLVFRSDSVLKNSFYKILKGKLDMLYPVESYIYEDERGLSGWIDNKRVLLGTRQHMEDHSIDGLPPVSKEAEYGKGNVILYLSISGVICTMFVLKITPSISVTKWMQALEKEGVVTVVRNVDGFLTQEFLESLFDLDNGSIKMLPFRYHKEYENEVGFNERESSPMMCSGSFPSFAMLITGVKKIRSAAQLGIAIQVGSVALGAAICLISMLLGTFAQITPTLIIVYHLVFAGIMLAMLGSKKI